MPPDPDRCDAEYGEPTEPGDRGDRITLLDLDGTHMGPAVVWWEAQHSGDNRTIESLKAELPATEMMRSGLEVLLSQAAWAARNDHESGGDHGVLILDRLAQSSLLLPSERAVCADLAEALAATTYLDRVTLRPTSVKTVMRLVVLFGQMNEHRFSIPVVEQIGRYRKAAHDAASTYPTPTAPTAPSTRSTPGSGATAAAGRPVPPDAASGCGRA